jgi:hypothetical protein
MALKLSTEFKEKVMRTRTSMAAIVLAGAVAGGAYAKHLNYAPDMSSPEYWDSHHIAAVRITNLNRADGPSSLISWQVENTLSDTGIRSTATVPLSHLWLDVERAPALAAGDRLIVFYEKDTPSVYAAVLLDARDSAGALESLRRIAQLRTHSGDFQAYLDAATAPDRLAARYSMRFLLSQTGSAQPAADSLARLLQIRNDESRESLDRILAARLLDRLQGSSDASESQYAWLQQTVANSRGKDWPELKPFAERLLEFTDKRSGTVAYLTQLAGTSTTPQPVRVAAYGEFIDPRLFRFDAPDADSARIFQTSLAMLSDEDPLMRRAGAALVYHITVRVNPSDRPEYLAQAKKALTDALSSEVDNAAQFHLQHFLLLLSE